MAFLFYFRQNAVLLYGDAVAHINIARRVFDSKTPGLLQLGTVWLPLPHLLMIPFLISTDLWRRGAGGSIPSMAAYVFAVAGIFRLTAKAFARDPDEDRVARIAAWTGALIFAANPNLIYMQSTAMSETLYLAFFIWSVAYLVEWTHGDPRSLIKCGLCLAAACLTRYDGWFLAAATTVFVLWRQIAARSGQSDKAAARSRRAVLRFLLIAASAPALWLAYNAIVYRNPLEFENGPYSAKAIELKSQSPATPGHPGTANLFLAGRFFLKSAEDNVAANEWLQHAWILLAIAALVLAAVLRKSAASLWPLLLLLAPLPFYALSIAYGGVPIFIPNWWPFTRYNVRYGLQLLPALAVAPAILVYLLTRWQAASRRLRLACILGVLTLVAVSYASIWRNTPICLAEAQINMRTRTQLETELALWIEKLPPDSTLLMYLGEHVGAAQRAGFPLRRTINEGNHRAWMRPADSAGLWEQALASPSQYADYVLAFEGDPVWQAVHEMHLHALVEIHVSGQARAVLYQAR
jgi:hypothetical protein